jgi:hypothetical protein
VTCSVVRCGALFALTWLLGAVDARAGAAPPADAVPFLCVSGVGVAFEATLTCRRADSGVIITPVPTGLYLHVTDIVVNPNNIATSGVFTGSIGRDDASDYPNTPSLDLIGAPTQQLHFTTPYLVLRGGEQLAVRNDASSLFPIDVRVSGFLSGTFVQPPPAIFADGFESS